MITMPNADSHTGRVLQEDNTELAYEALFLRLKPLTLTHNTNPYPCLSAQFARKFPVSPAPLASYFFQCAFMYSLFSAALSPGCLLSYVALTLFDASALCLCTSFSSSLNPMASHFASRFCLHVSSLRCFAWAFTSSEDILSLAAHLSFLSLLCSAKNASTLLASSLSSISSSLASRHSPRPCEILALVSSHRGPFTNGPSLRTYPEWRCPPFSTLYPLGQSVSCTAISLTSSSSTRSSLMPSTSTSFFMFSHPYFLIAHAIGAVPLWDCPHL